MGIFSSIKNAIFGKDEDEAAPAARSAAATPAQPAATGSAKPANPVPSAPRPMAEVDVEKKLDAMPGADDLNWRTSIVDLMKLVGLDPSYANRKELAAELGDADYSGTAEENIALHRRVMQEIARNGGIVPASLKD